MMLLDHIAISAIATKILYQKANTKLILLACFAGFIPDILAIFYHPGSIEYLAHRRYTNSLLISPFYTLLISLLFKSFNKEYNFLLIYTITTLNYILHIWLDHINEYGAPLFYPLSDKIYALDIIHSFDPIFLTISSAFFIYVAYIYFKKQALAIRILKIFMATYITYFSLMFIYKTYFTQTSIATLNKENISYSALTTTPKTFWRWKSIATQNNGSFAVIESDKAGVILHKSLDLNALPSAITQDSYLVEFLKYARFPAYKIINDQIYIYNVIYSDNTYALIYTMKNNAVISKEITTFDFEYPL
ncbi:metal-dependent hydrolase [Thiofilum flexile]|uniref:metal-dependent hydrolase n=1 Tax=Thiofilum flexile TaxID=125627 RepID=UPI000370B35E|nr:metal-dependent hydrolase [Thiofilum flexile]